MLAVCRRGFRDLETGELRSAGDTFEVTQERLDAINGTQYGTLAEPVEEAPKAADGAEKKVAKPRARRTRKPKEGTGE